MLQPVIRPLGARSLCVMALAAITFHTSFVHAQASNAAAPATAAMPSELKFESTLSRYKPMTDQKLGSWRDANDTVTRIGGWRSYLKEAQEPDTKPGAAPVPPVPPAPPVTRTPLTSPNPHAGHGVRP